MKSVIISLTHSLILVRSMVYPHTPCLTGTRNSKIKSSDTRAPMSLGTYAYSYAYLRSFPRRGDNLNTVRQPSGSRPYVKVCTSNTIELIYMYSQGMVQKFFKCPCTCLHARLTHREIVCLYQHMQQENPSKHPKYTRCGKGRLGNKYTPHTIMRENLCRQYTVPYTGGRAPST